MERYAYRELGAALIGPLMAEIFLFMFGSLHLFIFFAQLIGQRLCASSSQGLQVKFVSAAI